MMVAGMMIMIFVMEMMGIVLMGLVMMMGWQ